MTAEASAARIQATFRFGSFELDEGLFQLRCDGQPIAVEPRVFDTLRYLIRERGRVVPKDELLAQLWPGQFVSEASLTYCIKMARKAVGDSGSQQEVIKNLHGRGYRFVAPVESRPHGLSSPLTNPTIDMPTARAGLIGRAAEMARLRSSLAACVAGERQLALVSGEAGIGKTRIIDEIAAEARQRGTRVLIGRCYEGAGAPAFWPWLQILRTLFSGEVPPQLAELRARANDLAELLPEITPLLPAAPPSSPQRGADDRFRLFDSVTLFFKHLARAQPLVIALDDLHWADTASLRLLQFITREAADAAILLIGTYRDLEFGHDHPLTAALGDLARVENSVRLHLTGLSQAEVAQVITLAIGNAPEEELAAAVWKKSDGNPFFVTEIARSLADSTRSTATDGGQKVPIPPTVREATERRLLTLSKGTQLFLRLGAVIGRSFDVVLLAEAVAFLPGRKLANGGLVDLLAGAVEQKLIEPEDGGRFRFVHALTREAIYEQLSASERITFHHAVGEALAVRVRDDLGEHSAELANHFGHIGKSSDIPRAIRYATLAAQHAADLYAYEEAAALYERALALATQQPSEQRAEILLAFGRNQWKAGDLNQARATFVAAANLARAAGDAQQLARAALGYGGGFRGFELGVVEPILVDLLEEALQRLGASDDALRAQVSARLAVALYHVSGSLERRDSLTKEAISAARRAGDEAAHLGALYSRHWAIWAPDNLDDRLAVADTMVSAATQARDQEMRLHAHRFRYFDRLESADFKGACEDAETCAWLSEELRQPYYRWYVETFRAMEAMAAGQLAEAERLVESALRIGQRAQSQNVLHAYGAQLVCLRPQQGRVTEVEPILRGLVEQYPKLPSWRCGLAHLLSIQGKLDEARIHFEVAAEDDFQGVTRNNFWTAAMVRIADACADLGDRRRAAVLYDLLEPYALQIAVNVGGVCYGPISRSLGVLSAVRGNWPAAHEHFAQALHYEQQAGWTLLLAHTQRQYGEALLKAGLYAERATDLLGQARSTFERLGMTGFADQVAKFISAHPTKSRKPQLAIARARR